MLARKRLNLCPDSGSQKKKKIPSAKISSYNVYNSLVVFYKLLLDTRKGDATQLFSCPFGFLAIELRK